ncbi:MAG: valine--tRNA ligase [Thermoplasmata archaeon]
MDTDLHIIEKKWQKYWKEHNIYQFDRTDKNVYSIDTPPRYASGTLHIGHAVHYTHMDIIARYKRMRGFNVFFPLCFDVNGMPIEVNVEKKYNIKMAETDRHEFIKLCENFANSMIDSMIEQFETLGESMDPSIYYQTDAPYYRKITQLTFLEMAQKGLVYRKEYPITWCPRCNTAIAESEIDYFERDSKLNYIKFKVEDRDLIIATTRPELISACVLIAVNPEDERYKDIIGKTVVTPLYNKIVPLVADSSVDPKFGTGAMMICTIGDKSDLEFVRKYKIDLIEVFDDRGIMNELSGYNGLTIEQARAKIISDLSKQGLLLKQDNIKQTVGTCWRCGTAIEIIQKKQWFLKTLSSKKEMLESVEKLNWYPNFMKVRLIEWVNSLDWDWVISRHRYFATPIPAWECENGHYFLPDIEDLKKRESNIDPTVEPYKVEKCPICNAPLKGVEDVFDTWMDSSISPLYNTEWFRSQNFDHMYPMSLRPQAHDIIRTWAFYSLYRCKILTGKEPWSDIFIDGHILAPDGRPMHTSWGNVVNPLEIIKESGADTFRYFTAQCTLGEDTPFRIKEITHGNRLILKLFNIANFVKLNVSDPSPITRSDLINNWIIDKYSSLVKSVTENMDQYRYDKAIRSMENFLWHELADQYIEMIKFRIRNDENTKNTLYNVFLGTLKMFAPILPHVTEEIYQELYRDFENKESIHKSRWPEPLFEDLNAREYGELAKELVSKLRHWKSENGYPLSKSIESVHIISEPLHEDIMQVLRETLHIKNLDIMKNADLKEEITKILPDLKLLGPILKDHIQEFVSLINSNPTLYYQKIKNGFMFYGHLISASDVSVIARKTYRGKDVSTIEFSKGIIFIGD